MNVSHVKVGAPTATVEVQSIFQNAWVYTAGAVTYAGSARPSAATSDPYWQIVKYTYDVDGNALTKKFTSNSAEYAFVWDNRATYF